MEVQMEREKQCDRIRKSKGCYSILNEVVMTHKWAKILIEHDRLDPALIWCEENVGTRWRVGHTDGTWCCFWAGTRDRTHFRFHFLNDEDAVLFALRWS